MPLFDLPVAIDFAGSLERDFRAPIEKPGLSRGRRRALAYIGDGPLAAKTSGHECIRDRRRTGEPLIRGRSDVLPQLIVHEPNERCHVGRT